MLLIPGCLASCVLAGAGGLSLSSVDADLRNNKWGVVQIISFIVIVASIIVLLTNVNVVFIYRRCLKGNKSKTTGRQAEIRSNQRPGRSMAVTSQSACGFTFHINPIGKETRFGAANINWSPHGHNSIVGIDVHSLQEQNHLLQEQVRLQQQLLNQQRQQQQRQQQQQQQQQQAGQFGYRMPPGSPRLAPPAPEAQPPSYDEVIHQLNDD